MESDTDDDVLQVEDDYYTFLNIGKDVSWRCFRSDYIDVRAALISADPVAFSLRSDEISLRPCAGVLVFVTDAVASSPRIQATEDEIKNAYKRLSKIYHPDKHADPLSKRDAEVLFNKTRRAYDGKSPGLEPQPKVFTIVQRTKTPQEIREEYERLAREQEERRLQQRTNPKGSISVGIDATDLFEAYYDDDTRGFASAQGLLQVTPIGLQPGCNIVVARQLGKHTVGYLTWKAGLQSAMNTTVIWDASYGHFICALQLGVPNTFAMVSYTYKFPDEGRLKGSIKIGTFGAIVEYGVEKKISQHNTIGATMVIGVPSGVTLKLRLNRATQSFVFPIFLSEEPLPSAIFYGTVTPLVAWYILQTFVIVPYTQRQKQRVLFLAQIASLVGQRYVEFHTHKKEVPLSRFFFIRFTIMQRDTAAPHETEFC
ncbi:hypothetical protein HPB51_017528 [Rhipicephalus microplus]|uniref:J domain-containing protein n=1 Tax=Rhipicephalus microplus TaxID=6941 RepID=A0A9J6F4H2_RHIMP|nr:hypothetical protein HPB51_017528 [Rhipicephalus microplus]